MKNADGGATRAFGGSPRKADEPPVESGDIPNRARMELRRDRRREIERVVAERSEPLTIDVLTDRIMEWESERADRTLARIDLREQLYEIDLPSLEARDAVTFEADRGLVAASEGRTDTGEASSEMSDRGFERYYAVAIGLSAGLLGLSRAAIGPFSTVSPSITTAASLALVTLVAVADRVKVLR